MDPLVRFGNTGGPPTCKAGYDKHGKRVPGVVGCVNDPDELLVSGVGCTGDDTGIASIVTRSKKVELGESCGIGCFCLGGFGDEGWESLIDLVELSESVVGGLSTGEKVVVRDSSVLVSRSLGDVDKGDSSVGGNARGSRDATGVITEGGKATGSRCIFDGVSMTISSGGVPSFKYQIISKK